MELPSLGQHCSEASCRQLDFLPVKCDSCKNIYCGDHYSYVKHNCPTAFRKNVQVPVCPLCNALIPGKVDELPDIRVNNHIDNDCKSDTAINRRKVYSNRCSQKGCKQKELIPIVCDQCTLNYCLRHRHPQDHNCDVSSKPMGKAGLAAALRNQRKSPESSSHGQKSRSASVANGGTGQAVSGGRSRHYAQAQSALQGNMSEEAAFQLALQASMSEASVGSANKSSSSPTVPVHSQEQEDFLLAQAIAESERDAASNNLRSNQRKGNNCQIT